MNKEIDPFTNNSIFIGGNVEGMQIQQNTKNSSQTMNKQDEFDYEKISNILKEIKEYFELPKFNNDFKEKSDEIKNCVNETLEMVNNKKEPQIIKKSLLVLKDLVIGSSGSLIASGILSLINGVL